MDRYRIRKSVYVAALFLLVAAFGFLFAGRTVEAKGAKLNKKTVYLAPKMTVKLKVTGTKKKVTWKSSNKKVATVSKKGKVTAKKKGKVTITAKVGGKRLKCKVIVEKKATNNARKLRDFVVKKGEKRKDGEGKTYYALQYVWYDEESTEYRATITAYKGKYGMEFIYTINPDTAEGCSERFDMSIDLVKSTKGSFNRSSFHGWDDAGYEYSGTISTKFDGNGAGVTVSSYYDIGEDGSYSSDANPGSYNTTAGKAFKEAFQAYDKLLKKKKAGVTMKTIGFAKYK